MRELPGAMPPSTDARATFSLLEDVPAWVVEAPLYAYALWLALRYRGMALPAVADPKIRIGGIAGESKTDLYALVGPYARSVFAPFITFNARAPIREIEAARKAAGLAYPLVAKPDIGLNGRGVKIVASPEELSAHLAKFPAEADMLLQRYIADEGEAGIFYVRKPSEGMGRITSLTLKYFPRVEGDGVRTLRALIEEDPRTKKRAPIYLRRNMKHLDEVIPKGVTRRIVSVGNHVRGAVFADGAAHITPALEAAFEKIAKDMDSFYFGRFDVRFPDLASLERGEGITIIEYNGASSEPTHVRDPKTPPLKVWRDYMRHWKYAFEVGAEVRALGFKPPRLREVLKVLKFERELVTRYPDEE